MCACHQCTGSHGALPADGVAAGATAAPLNHRPAVRLPDKEGHTVRVKQSDCLLRCNFNIVTKVALISFSDINIHLVAYR